MTRPVADALPIELLDDWPKEFAGCVIGTRDASQLIGDIWLDDKEWAEFSRCPISSVRIDDHPPIDGWSTETGYLRWRRRTDNFYEVPVEPVSVPLVALVDEITFGEWVRETHGSSGRLLIWSDDRSWWLVHDADLEIIVTCGPHGVFGGRYERPLLWDVAPQTTKAEIDALQDRYDFTWDNSTG